MEELETVTQIIDSAVKDSSYITVIISSSVFILYTLIIKLVELFKDKNKSKPLSEMALAISRNTDNIIKLNQALDKFFKDSETKESIKINNVLTTSFSHLKDTILSFCINTIVCNNIQVRQEEIKQNIGNTVTNEYYRLYSILSAYEYNGVCIAEELDKAWIEEMSAACFNIMFNGDEPQARIRQIDNKLEVLTEHYSILINNKVFNH